MQKNYVGNTLDVTYGDNSNQYKLNNNDVFSVNTSYTDDKLSSSVINDSSNNPVVSKSYTYDNNNNITGLTVNNTQISYVYDGDKITEYHQGDNAVYYHYDSKDEITREDINYTGYQKTITYSYDSRGNLTSKKEYAYTRETDPGTPLESDKLELTYDDKVWLDEINQTPTETILYDENGNPVNLEDCTLEWTNGRQLKAVKKGNEVILSYTYDDNGIRTSKTYQGLTTYYTTENGLITSQYELDESGNKVNEVIFIYDNGSLVSAYYNNKLYYYITNAMGDVISIIDRNKNTVVNYGYDAWGNVVDKSVNSNLENTDFATANPMLYRSYYRDDELGVYYLQSRYYKSDWCRFINSDSPEIAKVFKDIKLSNNLYSYCYNNPVKNIDKTGYVAVVDDAVWASFIYSLFYAGIIAIGTELWTIAIVSIIQVVIDAIQSSGSISRTRTFPDVKAKAQKGKHYKVAYVNSRGELVKLGKKLTFIQALAALGITAKTNSVKKRYNFIYMASKVSNNVKKAYKNKYWGIYADSQFSAKALAVVLCYSAKPEVHGDGQYRHYHDKNHIIHIWYGSPFYY